VIEVFPTATLRAIGARSAGDGRGAKTSPAARRATHNTLLDWTRGMPEITEEGPLDADALDAIAAALTAAAFARGASVAVGEPGEGCIIVIDAARFAALTAGADGSMGDR
jgi:predicted nuclease with RNAse H fold